MRSANVRCWTGAEGCAGEFSLFMVLTNFNGGAWSRLGRVARSLTRSGELVGEFAQGQLHELVFPDGLRWIALHDLIGRGNARRNPAFCRHFGAVGDFDVAIDANLSTDHAMGTNFRGSGNACLCCNDGVLPNAHVVGHLDEVVQLHAFFQNGGAQSGPVNGGVGPDFATGCRWSRCPVVGFSQTLHPLAQNQIHRHRW